MPPPRWKYRLRFEKAGPLRLVSHHDLMHLCERLFRRAEVPFAVTAGFHPQPKITFALSLALGIAGRDEIMELELKRELPSDEIAQRLNDRAPDGLRFTSCRRLEGKSSMQVRRAFYRIVWNEARPEVPARVADFLAREACWVARIKPLPRRVNLLPLISELNATEHSLTMVLWITPTGAARPVEILRALGLQSLLEEGAFLERTRLELIDELPETERTLPDFGAFAESISMVEARAACHDTTETEESAAQTPLISSPMSYET